MIRKLTGQDIYHYKKLRLATLKNDPLSWLSTYEADLTTQDYQLHNKLGGYPPGSIYGYYGFFDEETMIGYVQLTDSYLVKKRHIVYIFELCIDPRHRRKSIASQLIKYVIEKAKSISDIEQIHLYVNSKNTPAINFYQKLGFTKVATLPKAVKELDDSYQDEYIFTLYVS